MQADRRELLQNRQQLPVWPTAECSRILDRYLDALVEELVAQHTIIGVHMPDPA
jgi:hypothetical protein